MKAAVWHGIGDVRSDAVPKLRIQEPADTLVRLTTSAICGGSGRHDHRPWRRRRGRGIGRLGVRVQGRRSCRDLDPWPAAILPMVAPGIMPNAPVRLPEGRARTSGL